MTPYTLGLPAPHEVPIPTERPIMQTRRSAARAIGASCAMLAATVGCAVAAHSAAAAIIIEPHTAYETPCVVQVFTVTLAGRQPSHTFNAARLRWQWAVKARHITFDGITFRNHTARPVRLEESC